MISNPSTCIIRKVGYGLDRSAHTQGDEESGFEDALVECRGEEGEQDAKLGEGVHCVDGMYVMREVVVE